MREDQIENGVKFLVHPKVKTAPLSQRISFLEGKDSVSPLSACHRKRPPNSYRPSFDREQGLTPEEISAALSRVDGQNHGDTSSALTEEAGQRYDNHGAPLASAPHFAAEADVPLWRKAAVPGALVLGAVGALGTYHVASRIAAAPNPATYSAAMAENGSRLTNAPEESRDGVAYTQEGSSSQEGHVDGGVYSEYADSGSFPRNERDLPGVGESSSLAGEFRRLTGAMEQQTGHLVEAVSAMKALASRAERDSSSLLAAHVNSHTSELRAELGTIKQLLLLRAGGAGGTLAESAAVSSSDTTRGKNVASSEVDPSDEQSRCTRKEERKASVASTTHVKAPEEREKAVGVDVVRSVTVDEKEKDKEDEVAAEAAARTVMERRKEAARTALSALLAGNAPQAAKDGIAMLRMLVANLVKQPNVPRYRRITTSNDNFKKRLLPLEGHRAMMEAIGFKAKGSLWEWTWHEESGFHTPGTNKAILEDIIAAIDAVARPNGPPMPTSSSQPIAMRTASLPVSSSVTHPAHTDNTQNPISGRSAVNASNGEARKAEPSWDRSGVTSSRAVAESMSAGGGVHAERVNGRVAFATAADKKVLSRDAVLMSGGTARTDARPDENGDLVKNITKEQPPVVPAEKLEGDTNFRGRDALGAETEENEEPRDDDPGSLPASIAEVAAAIQRGEDPPGIRVVEDRLSADASRLAFTSNPSPPKPWEAVSGLGAVEGMRDCGKEGGGRSGHGGGDEGDASSSSSSRRPHSQQHAVSVGP